MLDLQHPEITWIERTGYPSWMQPDGMTEDERRDAWEAHCDDLYEEQQARKLFRE